MPQLSFQSRFVEAVENGLDLNAGRPLRHSGVKPKLQTIRGMRKQPFRVEDTLYLCTGARTKQYRLLGEAIATSVDEIGIDDPMFCEDASPIELVPLVLLMNEAHDVAVRDGFEDLDSMLEFFEKTHGLPFHGQLIRWGEIGTNRSEGDD